MRAMIMAKSARPPPPATKPPNFKKKRTLLRPDPTRIRPAPPPPPLPAPRRLRARRRRPVDCESSGSDSDSDEDRASGRKLKLVLKIPPAPTPSRPRRRRSGSPPLACHGSPYASSSSSSPAASTSSSSFADGDDEDEEGFDGRDIYSIKPPKKRRIGSCDEDAAAAAASDSDGSGHRAKRKRNLVRRPGGPLSGNSLPCSGTRLPERTELELVLDKLQKKDTYRVFAEPVDPEELPDYHDVIEHPMDFGTIRKRLARGVYRSFEQFEDDVFLICSNAMQYNAPHTVYFRQARAIQDMARKEFQRVRADCKSAETARSDSKSAEIARSDDKSAETSRPDSKSAEIARSDSKSAEIARSDKKSVEIARSDRNSAEIALSDRNSAEIARSDSKSAETARSGSKFAETARSGGKFAETARSEGKDAKTARSEGKYAETVRSGGKCAETTRSGGICAETARSGGKSAETARADGKSVETARSDGKSAESARSDVKSADTARSDGKSAESARSDGKSVETVICYAKSAQTAIYDGKSSETVRADGKCAEIDCKSEEKLRFSSVEKKSPKKSQCRTAQEPLGSDISSGATLASAVETFTGLSTIQTSGLERSISVNGLVDGSSLCENKSEKADEISAKSSPSKLGLKQCVVDINRRATYNMLDQELVIDSDSVLDIFESETKQLVAVGLDSDYSYARSLSRFAASLGPVAWEIASKRIEKALPPGLKFGPGWVGEYEPLPTPVVSLQNHTHIPTILRKPQKSKAEMEATRNCIQKGMPFGLRNQAIIGMPNRASNPVKAGAFYEKITEQKPGLFGVNLEAQPRISNVTTQQKNHAAVNFAKCYANETAARRPEFPEAQSRICNATTQQENQATVNFAKCYTKEAAARNPEFHEAQPTISNAATQQENQATLNFAKCYTNKTAAQNPEFHEAQPRISNATTQQKNQAAVNFAKCYTNGTAAQNPEFHSETTHSKFPVISKERSQPQPEPPKQPQVLTWRSRNNDAPMMGAIGFRNGKPIGNSDSMRPSISSGIISNHQTGVQYCLAGHNDPVMNDSLRLISFSGMASHQTNPSSRGIGNLEQVQTVLPPGRENPSAVTAREWMSIGSSAEWKSVDGGGQPKTQSRPASFSSSSWRPPASASRAHEEFKVRTEPMLGFSEASQAQNKGLVIFPQLITPQLITADLSRLRSPWQGFVQQNKQKDMLPPDLNIGYQPPASPARPSSGILIDSQQPDLALQL